MNIIEHVIALIAPHSCLSCTAEGAVLCSHCAHKLPMVPSRCYRCRAATQNYSTCKKCRRSSPLFAVQPVTTFAGNAKEITHAFKFERAKSASKDVARIIAQRQSIMSYNIALCPVPTASRRVRMRGYDHTLLLAMDVAKLAGVTVLPLLDRIGQQHQVGATRTERISQLRGAFRVRTPKLAASLEEVVLIDDVLTTGASLEEAARTLRKAGVKRVYAITFAQTP